mgnify:FL=1
MCKSWHIITWYDKCVHTHAALKKTAKKEVFMLKANPSSILDLLSLLLSLQMFPDTQYQPASPNIDVQSNASWQSCNIAIPGYIFI